MFQGSIPAIITPFRDGAVDEAALIDLVEWHVAEGSHGIVAVGTTGETPTLSHAEHERVIEIVVNTVAGRIPVIAGAGSNSTAESTHLMAFAKKVGADAALVVTPYYNKPNQRGLLQHYRSLHDAVDLPIIIYNIPGRSVIDMAPATMAELAKLPRIVGVKDATGDVGRVSDTRMACGPDFLQLCGNDEVALGYNAHGGRGCISVVANIAPRLSAEFQNAMRAGEWDKALAYQDRLMPLHRAAFAEPNPGPTKFALSLLGRCAEEMRLPMVPLEEPARARMRAAMRHAGLLN